MQPEQLLRFGLYQLDPQTGQLWRGKQEVRPTPRNTETEKRESFLEIRYSSLILYNLEG